MDATFNNFAEHPGVYIEEELEARGWLQLDLAYILNVSGSTVNQIIRGKSGINAEMAKALGDAFDTSPELFLNLQKAWELEQARDPDPGVAKRSLIQSNYPLREMIRRGWIKDSAPDMLELQLVNFFEKESFDQVPHLDHAAKRIGQSDELPPAQMAWLFRVLQIAKEMVVPRYSETKLRKAFEQMIALRSESEQIRHVPRMLSECGVRLVIVEKLTGSKIDGVCTWIDDKKSPVIGMTTLHDRIDNFWFVLAHEISHVLHKHGQTGAIVDVKTGGQGQYIDEEEKLANKDAADFCIDQKKMENFYNRKNPYFYARDVLSFASRMGVHPGIVVGQIQNRTKDYGYLKIHQVSIRETLLSSATFDGWGHVAPVYS